MNRIDGETLRKVRIALNLTQDEVGAICGVTDAYINMIERGKCRLTERMQRVLADELPIDEENLPILLAEYERIMAVKRAAAIRPKYRRRRQKKLAPV